MHNGSKCFNRELTVRQFGLLVFVLVGNKTSGSDQIEVNHRLGPKNLYTSSRSKSLVFQYISGRYSRGYVYNLCELLV